jgi:hypothetical protein
MMCLHCGLHPEIACSGCSDYTICLVDGPPIDRGDGHQYCSPECRDRGPFTAVPEAGYGVRCIPCGYASDPISSSKDASQLAAVHDMLHGHRTGTATTHPARATLPAGAGTGFLERPRSDAELLEYCLLINAVLSSLATTVADWAAGLAVAGLPPALTGAISDTASAVRQQSRAALLAGAALEHDLAHARTAAAAGLVLTGHDTA